MKTKFILMVILFLSYNMYAQKGLQKDSISSRATINSGTTLRLYPTPAKTYINAYVQTGNPRPFNVAIYDSNNALIKQWDEGPNGSYQKAIDVTKMANGKYYLKITFDRGSLRQPFIVAH